jgi:hypothetical protein
MNTIHTYISNSTPAFDYDTEKGIFKLSGKSIPEDPVKIYQPIMSTIKDYCKNPADFSKIVIDFEYMNTSSSKWIFFILEQFENLYINKKKVEITFFYEDESMLQTGRYYSNNLAVPIDLIKK